MISFLAQNLTNIDPPLMKFGNGTNTTSHTPQVSGCSLTYTLKYCLVENCMKYAKTEPF
jgi:hypothetical protein